MTKFKFSHFFRPKKWQSPNFQAVSEYFRIISFGIPNSIRNLLLRVVCQNVFGTDCVSAETLTTVVYT